MLMALPWVATGPVADDLIAVNRGLLPPAPGPRRGLDLGFAVKGKTLGLRLSVGIVGHGEVIGLLEMQDRVLFVLRATGYHLPRMQG